MTNTPKSACSQIDKARAYFAKVDPAIQGQDGSGQTIYAASLAVNDFNLSMDEARTVLLEWNQRCVPPWEEKDLDRKLNEAAKKAPRGIGTKGGKSVRHTFGGSAPAAPTPTISSNPITAPAIKAKRYDLSDVPLPAPVADGARALLAAAFEPGEFIAICPTGEDDEGVERIKPACIFTRDEWLKRLNERDGDPNRIFSSRNKSGGMCGIYIGINPLVTPTRRTKDNITSFRHVLIEFDNMSLERQWDLIRKSNLPCTAVIFSGGKSVHAWVRVDAKDAKEYAERTSLLHSHFPADMKPDSQCRDESRLSRLAGCARGNGRQELLATKIGAKSFADWAETVGAQCGSVPKVPEFDNAALLLADDTIYLPAEIVSGLIHQNTKTVVGGGSKGGKTFFLIDLGMSVATGRPFLGLQTKRGRVVFINFEIAKAFMRRRVMAVASARGIPHATLTDFDMWNLRGINASLTDLVPELISRVQQRKPSLVIVDPIYKSLGERDENKAGDIAKLCLEIESLSVSTGAAVIYCAHYSKGNQSGKESIDRISGSGVFARDADSIVSLTKHREENCYTLETTLRNFPALPPFVLEWKHPVMTLREDLNPLDLKQAKPTKQAQQPDMTALSMILPSVGDMERETFLTRIQRKAGVGEKRAKEIMRDMVDDGVIHKWTKTRSGKRDAISLSRQPQQPEPLEDSK